MNKPLSIIDATTGMAFEMQIVQAQAAAKQAARDYDMFMENLRVRYDAPANEWIVTDWAEGFVRAPRMKDEGKDENAQDNP